MLPRLFDNIIFTVIVELFN